MLPWLEAKLSSLKSTYGDLTTKVIYQLPFGLGYASSRTTTQSHYPIYTQVFSISSYFECNYFVKFWPIQARTS